MIVRKQLLEHISYIPSISVDQSISGGRFAASFGDCVIDAGLIGDTENVESDEPIALPAKKAWIEYQDNRENVQAGSAVWGIDLHKSLDKDYRDVESSALEAAKEFGVEDLSLQPTEGFDNYLHALCFLANGSIRRRFFLPDLEAPPTTGERFVRFKQAHRDENHVRFVVLYGVFMRDMKRGWILPGGTFQRFYDIQGKWLYELSMFGSSTESKKLIHQYPNDEWKNEVLESLNFVAGTCQRILSLMACRNVELVQYEPPVIPGNRRARRVGKRRYKYKRLKISMADGSVRYVGYSNSVSEKKLAFHFCRGHIKDYTSGKGLFGKYRGRYWVSGHHRGDKKVGEVWKSYELKDGNC